MSKGRRENRLSRTIWEYHQGVLCRIGEESAVCNKMGEDGWELAAMIISPVPIQRSPLTGPEPAFLLVFKRPKASNGEASKIQLTLSAPESPPPGDVSGLMLGN